MLVRIGSTEILIDCGEGTQFQLVEARFKPGRLSTILISHLHGDHWFGLPGLLSSLSLNGRKRSLLIVGPEDLEITLRNIPGLSEDDLSYPVDFVSTSQEKPSLLSDSGLRIEWAPLDHSVECFGFRIEEPDAAGNLNVNKAKAFGIDDFRAYQRLKDGESVGNKLGQVIKPSDVVSPGKAGRVFAYVTDTRPCENGVRLARDADLLFHEATFMNDMRERAYETGHSTAIDAAKVARDAGARRLLLTHFSARYRELESLAAEARSIFLCSEAAVELQTFPVQHEGGA